MDHDSRSGVPGLDENPTTDADLPDPNAPISESKKRFWPITAFVLLTFLIDLILKPTVDWLLGNWPGFPIGIVVSCVAGFLIGQACFAVLIAGFYGRVWIYGFCLACAFGALGIILFWVDALLPFSFGNASIHVETQALWTAAAVPLAMLGSAIPMHALRYFLGMHLTYNTVNPPRRGRGLEEFLIVMAVAGSALFAARIPQVAWDMRTGAYWPIIGVTTLVLVALSMAVIVPFSLAAFLLRNRHTRLSAMVLCVAIASTIAGLFGNLLVTPAMSPAWLNAIIYGLLPSGYFFLGVAAFKHSGLRLARFARKENSTTARKNEAVIDPFGADEAIPTNSMPKVQSEAESGKWNVRILAAAILLVALMGSFAVSFVEYGRQNAERANAALAAELAETGGQLVVSARNPIRLTLGADAGDQELEAYTHLQELRSLDLSGSRITDAAAKSIVKFPKLTVLDLSNTNITPKILDSLHILRFDKLNLSGTNLEVDDVNQFLLRSVQNHSLVQGIDVSHMQWTLGELQSLDIHLTQSIGLRGYSLDDDQLLQLLDRPHPVYASRIARIDVRENNLNGRFLKKLLSADGYGFVNLLRLDDNPITDKEFSAALAVLPAGTQLINSLSLSNTQLTDGILPALAGISEMQIGDGKITELGVLKSLGFIRTLRIRSKQFDGKDFKNISLGMVSNLDLSNSGFDDEGAKCMQGNSINRLDVSHTAISDNALTHLGSLFIQAIDISHTQITTEGLLKGDLANCERVIVAFGQFSKDEIARISAVINLEVGGTLETGVEPGY